LADQERFLSAVGQPKPAAADPEGAWYTFERGVHKTGGGAGWADVWMKGHFAWEYKRKRKSLLEAYQQLLLYREDLENPPLLVVSDLDRFDDYQFERRVKQAPEKIGFVGGIFDSERQRLTVLAMLLENLGIDMAIQFGKLEDWKAAVAEREKHRGAG
jgi:hypothetical protein